MEAFAKQLGQLLSTGDLEEAVSLVRSVEKSDPARYHVGMSALARYRNDAAACLKHAQAAAQAAPDEPIVLQYMALAHATNGDFEAAERDARKAVERDKGLRSLGALGRLLLDAGKPAEAEKVFARMLERDPGHLQAMNGLGTARFQQGANVAALTAFADAFEADPEDPSAMQSLLNVCADAGKILGTIALASLVRDRDVSPTMNLALDMVVLHATNMLMQQFPEKDKIPNVDEVVDALLKSAAGRPPRVQLHVARALFDLHRFDEASRVAQPLASRPMSEADRGNLLYIQGLLADAAGDREAALEAYTQALQSDPGRSDACANALAILDERGDRTSMEKGEQLLKRVPAELRAKTPQLQYHEAIYLRRSGNTAEARKRLERVLRMTKGEGELGQAAMALLKEL